MAKLYTQRMRHWKQISEKDYLLPDKCKINIIRDGVVLPLKHKLSSSRPVIVNTGGVCDKEGEFIAGMFRQILYPPFDGPWGVCIEGYPFDIGKVKKDNRKVIWGGIILPQFGHCLLDMFSRLWYFVENPGDDIYVFGIHMGKNYIEPYARELLNLLGLKDDQILFVDEPTQFSEIIIPDESIHSCCGYRDKWGSVFKQIRNNVSGYGIKKIYLTRTQFEKNDTVGEEYFENYYRKEGFFIIAPEKLSVREQVALMKDASEVVCTEGTLSHLTLFCNEGISLTTLHRDPVLLIEQQLVDRLKKINRTAIDVSMNFLPMDHGRGGSLIGNNQNWQAYLKDQGIDCLEDLEMCRKVYDYLKTWCRIYSQPELFEFIKNKDFFSLLNDIYLWINKKSLDRKKYNIPEEDVTYKSYLEIKEKLIKLLEENKQLKKTIEESKKEWRELALLGMKKKCDEKDKEIDKLNSLIIKMRNNESELC